MALYKGFRHERSKGEDGLRINYWYLIRPDGGEDLAVIGREIKGSGGHYNYNSAPLFGMLSWVNSSEVRRWLQTKIADPQTLRSSSAQDNAFANPLSRHNSDVQLAGGQDGMPGLPTPSHHSDNSWGLPALMMPSGVRAADPLQVLGMPGASLFRNMAPGDAPVLDAHERNAMIGHTLGAVDALLVALRRRVGIEYTLTVVTREREVHVLGSAGTRWRPSSEHAAAKPYQPVDVSSSSGLGRSGEGMDGHQGHQGNQGNVYGGQQAPVREHTAAPPVNHSVAQRGGSSLADPELQPQEPPNPFEMPGEGHEEALTPTWQLQTKRALSDLWNLSELEESRKRSAHDSSTPMQLPDPLSHPLDPGHSSMEHCLP